MMQPKDDDVFGPKPILPKDNTEKYGEGMLNGEGEAMANYVKQNKRIPRRGEIGKTPDQIAKFESIGFVMSGSRNRKMTAVRIAKESQVYSAEERRLLEEMKGQSAEKKENELIANLRLMVNKQTKEKKLPFQEQT